MRQVKRKPSGAASTTTRNIIDLGGIPPADYALATTAMGMLREFADYCKANDPACIAKAIQPHEVAALRRWFVTVRGWNQLFVLTLCASEAKVKP